MLGMTDVFFDGQLFNFVVVMVTPRAIAGIGGRYYIVFAVTNAVIVVLLHIYFPEVGPFDLILQVLWLICSKPARLGLEEVDRLFEDGKVTVRRSPRAPVEKRYPVAGTYSPGEKMEDDQRSLA